MKHLFYIKMTLVNFIERLHFAGRLTKLFSYAIIKAKTFEKNYSVEVTKSAGALYYRVKGVDILQERPENVKIRLEAAVELYSDMLLRVALNLLGSVHDAEDAVQDTYLQYLRHRPVFESDEHEKAWLLRVCINVSKNIAKSRSRRVCLEFDKLENVLPDRDERDTAVMEAVMQLSEKNRIVVLLYYIEGMSTSEIAKSLDISETAVRKRLQKARAKLKSMLE